MGTDAYTSGYTCFRRALHRVRSYLRIIPYPYYMYMLPICRRMHSFKLARTSIYLHGSYHSAGIATASGF